MKINFTCMHIFDGGGMCVCLYSFVNSLKVVTLSLLNVFPNVYNHIWLYFSFCIWTQRDVRCECIAYDISIVHVHMTLNNNTETVISETHLRRYYKAWSYG